MSIWERIAAALQGGSQGYLQGRALEERNADRKMREREFEARMNEMAESRKLRGEIAQQTSEDRRLEQYRKGFRPGRAPGAQDTGLGLGPTVDVPGPAQGVGAVVPEDRYRQVSDDLFLDRYETPEYMASRDRQDAESGRMDRFFEGQAFRDMLNQRDWQHRGVLQDERMAAAYQRMVDAIQQNYSNRQNDPAAMSRTVASLAQTLIEQSGGEMSLDEALKQATESLRPMFTYGIPTPANPDANDPGVKTPLSPHQQPVMGNPDPDAYIQTQGGVKAGQPAPTNPAVDQNKLRTDPQYRAWVLKQMGLGGHN